MINLASLLGEFSGTQYPLTSLLFEVSIGGSPLAYFSEVSGLGGEIEVEEYKEGGNNEFVHKLPRLTKYNNLVLKRGMTSSTYLYDWFEKIASGQVIKKDVTITLKEIGGDYNKTWRFAEAFPVKLSATDLNAQSNAIMIETMELAHRGMVLGR